ncbi:hypothetical protein [Mycobacterium sp. 1423905.2]|uniref:hypothetical protein n=1 Tax=Mycobacterium sp. 1423905.2 TaxID=1856859 RepID=UPI0007FE0F67|nr:hypothetical protein [Mycobacterium sp. 1423905.2]OBJ62053.1 hypothetical protein A9W95_08405 [Mycobacterium sp. 1423905.2]
MASVAQSGSRVTSLIFGALMVASASVDSQGPAIVVVVAACLAVVAGMLSRPAATVAVLLSGVLIVAADASPGLAAVSGLCAAAYLVCRHAEGSPFAVVIGSWPTILAAVGFSFVGLVATQFPLEVPWLPLLAPLAVLAIYVLATRPFLR